MCHKPSIYDQSKTDITNFLIENNEAGYRLDQIWKGLYCNYWQDASQFSILPTSFRNVLTETYSFHNLSPKQKIYSSDRQTSKVLFELNDHRTIETVLMSYRQRQTLCISTQAGCAMGCVFCATGQMGFMRNLSSGEIIEQVLFFARELENNNEKLTNIVVMGMGEPFHNYEATLKAIDVLNDNTGFNFGARRFTISTVGLIPAIRRFTKENRQVNLAISLHAADDKLRSSLLPVNRKYPLSDLIEACRFYVSSTKRRITFEWALIEGVNDSLDQANKLADISSDLLCHVNLIVLNPTKAYKEKPTSEYRAREFKKALEGRGITCSIRLRRGIDIQAGCGQLATKVQRAY